MSGPLAMTEGSTAASKISAARQSTTAQSLLRCMMSSTIVEQCKCIYFQLLALFLGRKLAGPINNISMTKRNTKSIAKSVSMVYS